MFKELDHRVFVEFAGVVFVGPFRGRQPLVDGALVDRLGVHAAIEVAAYRHLNQGEAAGLPADLLVDR